MQNTRSSSIQRVSPTELDHLLPALSDLLRQIVNGGSFMGFVPPLSAGEARDYWLSLRAEMAGGSRILLTAYADDRLVGSGQLLLATMPAGRHRAEVQKLFVAPGLRGRGVGRALMLALHQAARERGRTRLYLNTRRGNPAEDFYKGLGYREVGMLPGWTIGPAGEAYDHVTLCHELAS